MEGQIKAWSFHRLLDYEKCDYLAWLKYFEKVPEPEEKKDSAPLVRGREVHDHCEAYIRGERDTLCEDKKVLSHAGKFRFDEYRTLFAEDPARFEMEEQWGFDENWAPCGYFDEEVWLRVVLDRLLWLDDEHTAAEITDYKTGKKEGNEVKHAMQGQLYAASAFAKYPELQSVSVLFEYLDHGKTTRKDYTREQAVFFMTTFDKRGRKMTTATRFSPKPNKINCRWCPYGPNNGGSGYCDYGVEV